MGSYEKPERSDKHLCALPPAPAAHPPCSRGPARPPAQPRVPRRMLLRLFRRRHPHGPCSAPSPTRPPIAPSTDVLWSAKSPYHEGNATRTECGFGRRCKFPCACRGFRAAPAKFPAWGPRSARPRAPFPGSEAFPVDAPAFYLHSSRLASQPGTLSKPYSDEHFNELVSGPWVPIASKAMIM